MRSGWDCKAQRTGLCCLSGASNRLALSTRILGGSGCFPNGVLTDRRMLSALGQDHNCYESEWLKIYIENNNMEQILKRIR
jgi:hypothetical protein